MKHPIDLARRFLAVADRGIKTLNLLVAASESDGSSDRLPRTAGY